MKTEIHLTPDLFKEKLKFELAEKARLEKEAKQKEMYLNDVVGAYVMGAKLPQDGLRLDENYNFVYQIDDSVSQLPNENSSDGNVEIRPLTREDRVQRHN